MLMTGSLYLTDNLDLICKEIQDLNNIQKCMVIDFDETSDKLESLFPKSAFKGTVLLPPPSAIFLEIDGDHDSFMYEYGMYLNSEPVTEYISSILLMIYSGINTFLYVPSYSEDSIWLNTLLKHLELVYGIHVGTTAEDNFKYNPQRDIEVANLMYMNNCINIFTYMQIIPEYYNTHHPLLVAKISLELRPYSGEIDPFITYMQYVHAYHTNSFAPPAPVITFDI